MGFDAPPAECKQPTATGMGDQNFTTALTEFGPVRWSASLNDAGNALGHLHIQQAPDRTAHIVRRLDGSPAICASKGLSRAEIANVMGDDRFQAAIQAEAPNIPSLSGQLQYMSNVISGRAPTIGGPTSNGQLARC